MRWKDPHFSEWAETIEAAGEKWIGIVRRRSDGPAQAMTGETIQSLWSSEPCDTEADALQKAKERVEQGPPW